MTHGGHPANRAGRAASIGPEALGRSWAPAHPQQTYRKPPRLSVGVPTPGGQSPTCGRGGFSDVTHPQHIKGPNATLVGGFGDLDCQGQPIMRRPELGSRGTTSKPRTTRPRSASGQDDHPHIQPKGTLTLGTTDDSRLVTPEEFATAMTARWRSLGNTPSPRLQELWMAMATTFNRSITDSLTIDPRWRVLQPPTGTGKTQGLCVYSALTIDKNSGASEPIGILVVTRTIAQAEEIGATIRELISNPAQAERVRVSHSQNRLHSFAMQAADVLIVTHEAYTRALEGLNREQHEKWEDFTNWTHGPRRLTIIDEALSGIVEENQVTAANVRVLLGFISPELRKQFPAQVAALERVCEVLEKIAAFNSDTGASVPARIVWRGGNSNRRHFPMTCSMAPLREAMAGVRYDRLASDKDSSHDRRRMAEKADKTLKDCEAIMARWSYYFRKGNEDTFNSSQLLIPPGLPGPVVLDATASQNFTWKLMGDRAEIADIPSGTRNYGNVKMHVARGSGLGKHKMTEKGKVRIPRLLANLKEHLPSDRKLLVCLHKKIEHVALGYAPGFDKYSIAHWWAIDGKNNWNDHDAVVILGLPYRDAIWATNSFFALKGLQANGWLQQPSWGVYRDVRREMQRRQLSVSIIQAINRVRCRRVIDADGNCPPTGVFIVLPHGSDGDAILAHLKEEMPGVVVVPWDFAMDGPSERIRRGSSHEALIALMGNRLPGETPMSLIKSELGLSASATKELREVLRNDEHELTKTLAQLGVRYVTSGRGRGSRSFLLKQALEAPNGNRGLSSISPV